MLLLAAGPVASAEILEAGSTRPDKVVAEFRVGGTRLVLVAGDIAEAAPSFGQNTPGLDFRLAPDAGRLFADLTEGAIGQEMSLDICGDTLVTATIRERLDGAGHVAFESLGEAVFYATRLTGEITCD
ncbi:hypothetical protein [Silicimonas sp. MF1-12-2]|uniref:hypothetical protein n=1 Tax=Silicimonas sp. MF1-12-2 TaxID=3384793 RepID=UPI0039B4386C